MRAALRSRRRSRPAGAGSSRGTKFSIDDMQASILTPRRVSQTASVVADNKKTAVAMAMTMAIS
jgi:hypothetical protein